MSDSSVGKISLEVEIIQSSLQKEITSLGPVIGKAFHRILQAPIEGARRSLQSLVAGMKGAWGGGDMSSGFGGNTAKMQKHMESLQSTFDKTQAKITGMQTALSGLYAEQDAIIQQYMQMPPLAGMTGDESLQKLLAADTAYARLSAQIDKLQAQMDPLISKNQQAKEEIRQLGQALEQAGNRAAQSGDRLRSTADMTRRAGDEARTAGGKFGAFAAVLNRSLMTVLRRVFVYNLMLQGIRGLMRYMGDALKTNAQFSASLNQIKTNLAVAFQPIYNVVLPTINALMQRLASVTRYVASFLSALGGKTYAQSLQAAKGLETAKKAVEEYGKASKDAQGTLASFDELNVLNIQEQGQGAGGGLSEEAIETDAGKFREIFSSLFEPFQVAWEDEGQRTVASIRDALTGVWSFVTEIGRSFAQIWSEGSGQAILEGTLRVLQDIFQIAGSIANTFAVAWVDAGTGTAIVQGIFNIVQNLLVILVKVGESIQRAWGEHGANIAAAFLSIIGSIVEVLDALTEKLIYVWDHGGSHLFEGLIGLGAKVMELADYILTEFVAPFVHWFLNMISPAVATVADWVGRLLTVFTNMINWLLGDGKPVLDIIVVIVSSLATAFGTVTAAIKTWKTITTLGTAVAKGFSTAISFLTSAAGLWVIGIAAVIAAGVLLYKNWDTIKEKAGELWEGIKKAFSPIGKFFSDLWEGVKKGFAGFVNFIIRGINSLISGFLAPLNELIKGWNATIGKVAGTIPTIKVQIPSITSLARGGIVDQPILAMVGDNKNARTDPEVAAPLSKLQELLGIPNQAVIEVLLAILDAIERIDPSIEIDGERLSRRLETYRRNEAGRRGKSQVLIGGLPV